MSSQKPSRSVRVSHSPLYFQTDSLHLATKSAIPCCSMSCLPSSPSVFSTSISTGSPWVSQPALRSTWSPHMVR